MELCGSLPAHFWLLLLPFWHSAMHEMWYHPAKKDQGEVLGMTKETAGWLAFSDALLRMDSTVLSPQAPLSLLQRRTVRKSHPWPQCNRRRTEEHPDENGPLGRLQAGLKLHSHQPSVKLSFGRKQHAATNSFHPTDSQRSNPNSLMYIYAYMYI